MRNCIGCNLRKVVWRLHQERFHGCVFTTTTTTTTTIIAIVRKKGALIFSLRVQFILRPWRTNRRVRIVSSPVIHSRTFQRHIPGLFQKPHQTSLLGRREARVFEYLRPRRRDRNELKLSLRTIRFSIALNSNKTLLQRFKF